MWSSAVDTTLMLMSSDSSDFLLPHARFMVKCVLAPLIPSFLFTFFEMKLVFEPPSSVARTVKKSVYGKKSPKSVENMY